MSDIAISVENVSKVYKIGTAKKTSLVETFSHNINKLIGKKDEISSEEEFWALKDISFDIKKGDAVGIIGKNGAGKSTLLKILSRITEPSSGRIEINGRVASLLEVGTGFHPELTGKENIFLNGTILGMKRGEIKSKLEEIIEFSGISQFVDTPVKRYSSGMYVRLAFAVAAHLEPEILIIDEVLAVGDAEFQKKCLGKMQDVTGQGRTVIFVSHNMTAVTSLCNNGIFLQKGKVTKIGNAETVVQGYLSSEQASSYEKYWEIGKRIGDDVAELHWARLVDENNNKIEFVNIDKKIGIQYKYHVKKLGNYPLPNIHVYTLKGEIAFISGEVKEDRFSKAGIFITTAWIPANLLNQEVYIIGIALSTMIPETVHFFVPDALVFEVIEDVNKRNSDYKNFIPGVLRPSLQWETINE